jgi:LacI family transcriptional regulator
MSRVRTKASLTDVAKAANVSVATVSRALWKPNMVSHDLREKVARICKEMDYIPNRIARSLRKDRTETIGLIVPTVANPVYASTIAGVRDVLDEIGHGLFISFCERDPVREYAEVQTLLEHGVDAILSIMPEHVDELYGLLRRSNVPWAFLSPGGPNQPTPHVNFDNVGAMKSAVRYVMEKGHRDIAVLSGPHASTPVIGDRLEAVLSELALHRLSPPPEWVVECDYEPICARAGARRILEAAQRPTAVVCTGDQHAVACIAEAGRMGLSLPRDLSVTGCNDMSIAQLCEPQLTTIRPPYREIGATACRLVLSAQEGRALPERTVLEATFIERGSVAVPGR